MYRIRIKKAPIGLLGGNRLEDFMASNGRYLPKAQTGGVVDHYKKKLLERDGKYLITDKGTNRTYYGYPGADGKLVENSFEVLTGATSNNNTFSPYKLAEMEKMSAKDLNKVKITPVGEFPLIYSPSIYGNPGLHFANASAAMHITYDPPTRDKYYNNNRSADNYASYGCINCRKPDIDNVLKGFGTNDRIRVVDSRRSVQENDAIARDNEYLSKNREGARMLFERPGSRLVRRQWNADRGVYEGEGSDFDPYTDTIISKKDLGNVTVYANKKKVRERVVNTPRPSPNVLTPLQESLAASDVPIDKMSFSIVNFLNERGIDASKENRMQIARSLGMNDYAYTAEDNINLLRVLERMQEEGRDVARQMAEGGDVDGGQRYNLRQSIEPVKRQDANIEAERGETITGDFDYDGMDEHLVVGGKRHANGGTPLMVPSGSFVFSDTKKLKIGGDVLREFGKTPGGKKKYTPAELSMQYDINKYKAIILDPASDNLAKETAKLMLENNQLKLSKLALLQEGMKGFPNGIPGIALPLIQTALAMTPGVAAPPLGGEGLQQGGVRSPAGMTGGVMTGGQGMAGQGWTGNEMPAMQSGGEKVPAYGGDKTAPRKHQQQNLKLKRGFNKYDAPWLSDYGYENNPTGLDKALRIAGYQGNAKNVKEVQRFLINENLKRGNIGLFNDLLKGYGLTNQGVESGFDEDYGGTGFKPEDANSAQTKEALEKIYADGLFGVRSGLLLKSLLPPPAKVPNEPIPLLPRSRPSSLIPKRMEFYRPELELPEEEEPLAWRRGDADIPMNWWTQDELNAGAAFGNRYGLRKYMPTYVSTDVVLPRPTFFDPTRQLAANQEAAAAQNMMTAMFAGPQRQRGVSSNIQGQAASNAANILAQVQNQNVGIANQFAGVTADSLNKNALQDAIARKTYLDELTTVNQQYDNSKMLANAHILNNINNGITNSQETYWLNKMNEQYAIDPQTGRLSFTHGKSPFKASGNSGGETNDAVVYNYYFNQFKLANPNLSEEDAKAYATMKVQAHQRSSNNEDQRSGISLSDYINNPAKQGGRSGG